MIDRIYEHIKTGNLYRVVQIARDSEDPDKILVVYKDTHKDQTAWVRDVSEFARKFKPTASMLPEGRREVMVWGSDGDQHFAFFNKEWRSIMGRGLLIDAVIWEYTDNLHFVRKKIDEKQKAIETYKFLKENIMKQYREEAAKYTSVLDQTTRDKYAQQVTDFVTQNFPLPFAFTVKCNEENNPPSVVAAGRINIDLIPENDFTRRFMDDLREEESNNNYE